MNPPPFTKTRLLISFSLILTIVLGLASRKYPFLFPSFLGKYPGDALWAIAVYLGWRFLKPSSSIQNISVHALATSYLVELSQLYQAANWLNMIRKTTVGHLILGSTFSWHDMFAYTIGIIIMACAETLIRVLAAHHISKQEKNQSYRRTANPRQSHELTDDR